MFVMSRGKPAFGAVAISATLKFRYCVDRLPNGKHLRFAHAIEVSVENRGDRLPIRSFISG